MTQKSEREFRGQEFRLKKADGNEVQLKTTLVGKHQMLNASMAVVLAEALKAQGYHISEQAICRGAEKTKWPGRFEVAGQEPLIILDGAHNPASCRALGETIFDVLPQKRITFVRVLLRQKGKPPE